MKKSLVAVVMMFVVGVAIGGWLCRADLMARYYTHRLLTASDDQAVNWADQAGDWGDGVPDRLFVVLTGKKEAACTRASAALSQLRIPSLPDRLAERFPQFSGPGQQAAISYLAALATKQEPEVLTACARIIQPALQSSDAGVRLRAAALASRPGIGQPELLVPLLKDRSPEVRKAAIVAVGPFRVLIADDDLLYLLHDSDADVCRLAEAVLRSRGLRPEDVQAGRLLTDVRPAARLQLVDFLRDEQELDLTSWLRKLSDDPIPAVRAAAVRLAEERQVFQLTERVAQMANDDPDRTVRQTANYYLGRLRSVVRPIAAP